MTGPDERRSVGGGAGTLAIAVALAALASYFATLRFALPEGAAQRKTETIAVGATLVAPAPPALSGTSVQNVILLIGDGMGGAQIAAGRTASRGPAGRLRLEQLPITGLVVTAPEGGLVAKSDAAATALATGRKTANGRIGTDPLGRALPTILEALIERGWATGLVTTSRITDATPAAFATHVAERRMQAEIAAQLVASRVDLLVGGGRRYFVPHGSPGSARADDRDLVAEARGRGIAVVEDPAGFAAASALPLFALFAFEPQEAPGRDPSIGALAKKGIELLAATGRPFFALIEEEEIDSAAHRNDIAALAAALERFDAAVGAAVDFAARDGATLVLVTGDHATGGPAIAQRSTRERMIVVWESDDHTGEPVPLFAYGPPAAAARFGGVYDNTEVPRRIADVLGIEFPSDRPAIAGAAEAQGAP